MKLLPSIFLTSVFLVSASNAQATERSPFLAMSEMQFIADSGEPFDWTTLSGTRVVVAMAYTTCVRTCPLTVRAMEKIRRASSTAATEFVIITLDPETDTPARLKKYFREKWGLRQKNWHFLRASETATQKLAQILGIEFETSAGHIVHDGKIIFLDQNGRIEKSLNGWNDADR